MSGEAPPEAVDQFSDQELADMGFNSWTPERVIENPTKEQMIAAGLTEEEAQRRLDRRQEGGDG
jgi:hypothetical protein